MKYNQLVKDELQFTCFTSSISVNHLSAQLIVLIGDKKIYIYECRICCTLLENDVSQDVNMINGLK